MCMYHMSIYIYYFYMYVHIISKIGTVCQGNKMFCEDQSDYVLNNNVKNSWINGKQNTSSSFEHESIMRQQLVSQDVQHMQAMLEQSSTSPTKRITLNQENEKKQKSKRTRTAYTSEQLMQLETEFQSGRYLCRARRIKISATLNLTEKQIKVWFQNRRMKYKKDNKSDINLLMLNDQTELAGYSRNMPACSAKHIFNVTTNSPKLSASMILKNNNVQMSNLACTYLSDVSESTLQNGLSAIPDYGVIDQQQLKQAQQNFPSVIVQQTQVSYNTLPDHESYSHQQQCFHSQQQLTNHTANHYPQLDNNLLQQKPQINNFLQQQWEYEHMQNNSDTNPYAQVQSNYADVNIRSTIANDISNQIMSSFMSESKENCHINDVPSLPPFLSCFMGNSDQVTNENTTQLTNINPVESHDVDFDLLEF